MTATRQPKTGFFQRTSPYTISTDLLTNNKKLIFMNNDNIHDADGANYQPGASHRGTTYH